MSHDTEYAFCAECDKSCVFDPSFPICLDCGCGFVDYKDLTPSRVLEEFAQMFWTKDTISCGISLTEEKTSITITQTRECEENSYFFPKSFLGLQVIVSHGDRPRKLGGSSVL